MRAALLSVALGLLACVPADGPLMEPGQDCLRCHGGATVPNTPQNPGFEVRHARTWTLAGTVYGATDADLSAGILGAYVDVTDANGFSFQLRTNEAGNFYSAESVVFPLTVCVELGGTKTCQQSTTAYGSCNACHTVPPTNGAAGRLTP